MAAQIQETRKYSLFTSHINNRTLRKNDALLDSMRTYGWLDAYPAHVVKDNGMLKVKAGHHRVAVAIQLGIPIKYIVCEDGGVSIFELEKSAKPWSVKDYLEAHCRNGNPNYLTVRHYCDEYGLSPGCVITLLSGKNGANSSEEVNFKEGEFVVKTTDLIDPVIDVLETIRVSNTSIAPTGFFVQALADVIRLKEVDVEVLKRKITLYPSILQKQVSKKDYIKNLEELYNRKNSSKIPLSILVEEDNRRRKKEGSINALLARNNNRRARLSSAIHEAVQDALQ